MDIINNPPNHNKLWSQAEEKQLENRFKAGWELHKIVAAHKRTRGAVLGRLVRIGLLINESGRYYKNPIPDSLDLYVDTTDLPANAIQEDRK